MTRKPTFLVTMVPLRKIYITLERNIFFLQALTDTTKQACFFKHIFVLADTLNARQLLEQFSTTVFCVFDPNNFINSVKGLSSWKKKISSLHGQVFLWIQEHFVVLLFRNSKNLDSLVYRIIICWTSSRQTQDQSNIMKSWLQKSRNFFSWFSFSFINSL